MSLVVAGCKLNRIPLNGITLLGGSQGRFKLELLLISLKALSLALLLPLSGVCKQLLKRRLFGSLKRIGSSKLLVFSLKIGYFRSPTNLLVLSNLKGMGLLTAVLPCLCHPRFPTSDLPGRSKRILG